MFNGDLYNLSRQALGASPQVKEWAREFVESFRLLNGQLIDLKKNAGFTRADRYALTKGIQAGPLEEMKTTKNAVRDFVRSSEKTKKAEIARESRFPGDPLPHIAQVLGEPNTCTLQGWVMSAKENWQALVTARSMFPQVTDDIFTAWELQAARRFVPGFEALERNTATAKAIQISMEGQLVECESEIAALIHNNRPDKGRA